MTTETLQIIDDFLSEEDLKHWQDYCLKVNKDGTIFPLDDMLYKKTQILTKLDVNGQDKNDRFLYIVKSNTPINIHNDPNTFVTIFYPFDSDGDLRLYEEDEKKYKSVKVKENRLVFFNCGLIKHAAQAPKDKPRYALVIRWRHAEAKQL